MTRVADEGDQEHPLRQVQAGVIAAEMIKLISTMRSASRRSLRTFIHSAENGEGGTLILQAPCDRKKRRFVEAAFRAEGFVELVT